MKFATVLAYTTFGLSTSFKVFWGLVLLQKNERFKEFRRNTSRAKLPELNQETLATARAVLQKRFYASFEGGSRYWKIGLTFVPNGHYFVFRPEQDLPRPRLSQQGEENLWQNFLRGLIVLHDYDAEARYLDLYLYYAGIQNTVLFKTEDYVGERGTRFGSVRLTALFSDMGEGQNYNKIHVFITLDVCTGRVIYGFVGATKTEGVEGFRPHFVYSSDLEVFITSLDRSLLPNQRMCPYHSRFRAVRTPDIGPMHEIVSQTYLP